MDPPHTHTVIIQAVQGVWVKPLATAAATVGVAIFTPNLMCGSFRNSCILFQVASLIRIPLSVCLAVSLTRVARAICVSLGACITLIIVAGVTGKESANGVVVLPVHT